MRKETKLTRIPQREKFTDWKFELPHKNIILDSIKAYGCKKDEIKTEIPIQIYICPNNPLVFVSCDLMSKDYDCILLKYDIVQETTVLTIEASDCIYGTHDSKGNYAFYMKKNAEINI